MKYLSVFIAFASINVIAADVNYIVTAKPPLVFAIAAILFPS
ncbi:MAG: hypothetical protein ACI910_000226 [Oleispira sp.]|jgi:hypothetical protein